MLSPSVYVDPSQCRPVCLQRYTCNVVRGAHSCRLLWNTLLLWKANYKHELGFIDNTLQTETHVGLAHFRCSKVSKGT